jgi:hypothetical protein
MGDSVSRLVRVDDTIHQILVNKSVKYGTTVSGLSNMLLVLGLLVTEGSNIIKLDEEEKQEIMKTLAKRMTRIYLEAQAIHLAKKLQRVAVSKSSNRQ